MFPRSQSTWLLPFALLLFGCVPLCGQGAWTDADLTAEYDSLLRAATALPPEATGERARLLHAAGNAASGAGDFQTAIDRTEEALELRLSDEAEFFDGVLVSATNLGIYHNRLKNYRDALDYFGMVLNREPNRKVSAVLYQSGLLYEKMGEFAAAERAFVQAAAIPYEPQSPRFKAYCQRALASLYLEQGDSALARKAVPLLERARDFFRSEDYIDAALQATVLLGWAHVEAGEYAAAIRTLSEGQARAAEIDAYPEDWSALHSNLGLAYRRSGEPGRAADEYRAAIAYGTMFMDPTVADPSAAVPYDNLSTLFLETGRPDSALHYANRALEIATVGFTAERPDDLPAPEQLLRGATSLLLYLRDKARAHAALGEAGDPAANEAALATYRLADEMLDEMRRDQLLDETRTFWRADAREIYTEALAICARIDDPVSALHFMEKARARLLLDERSAGRARENLPEDVRERLRVLAARARSGQTSDLQVFHRYQDSIFQVYPDFALANVGPSPLPVNQLAKTLGGATLVAYFLGPEQTYALTGSGRETLQLHTLAPAGNWEDDLRAYLRSLRNPYEQVVAELPWTLYRRLLAPLDIPEETPLLIVPDGILYQLPFAALITEPPLEDSNPGGWPWLAERHPVNYGFSVQHLGFSLEDRRGGNGQVLAIAPVARVPPGGPISAELELPSTLHTVNVLLDHFKTDTLLNQAATPENFRRFASHYSLLHLGTHGRAADGGSFLLYDQARPFFPATELPDERLAADLVVVGACETGLGEDIPGEGVASLGRNFVRKGAGGVVMSLWSVDDAATDELLSKTYAGIARGDGPATALNAAGRAYRAEGINATLLHPYYWAGLVHYGPDVAPRLREGGLPAAWYWVWGLVMVGVLLLLVRRGRGD